MSQFSKTLSKHKSKSERKKYPRHVIHGQHVNFSFKKSERLQNLIIKDKIPGSLKTGPEMPAISEKALASIQRKKNWRTDALAPQCPGPNQFNHRLLDFWDEINRIAWLGLA